MPDMIKTISEIFSNQIFRIPDYQRGYAWEPKQWNDLLDDLELLPGGRSHFTGTLVLRPVSNGGRKLLDAEGRAYRIYEVIDGQQRLTTAVILLKAIHDEMLLLPGFDRLAEGLRETYLHHQDLNRQPFTKLTLNCDSQVYFVDNVLGLHPGVAGPSIRSHQRLQQAGQHFSGYLSKKREELGEHYPDWLKALYFKITHQLTLIVYPVDDELDAGIIFETMNDRGKPLTELEKVKNYLLYLSSKLDLPAAHDLTPRINAAWQFIYESLMAAGLAGRQYEDQLLRAHWLMAYDYDTSSWDNSRSIKDHFNFRQYQGRHQDLLQNLYDYLATLQNAAAAYTDIYAPHHPAAFQNIHDPDLRAQIVIWSKKLARLGPRAGFLPLLIAVRLKAEDEGESYLETVQLCEKFDFRVYQWLRLRSNTGESTLFRLGYQFFQNPNPGRLIADLARTLLDYCPDARFEERFQRADENWYRWGGITYLLYEYEHHLAGGRPVQMTWEALSARPKDQSVEHVLPQTPEDTYWKKRFNVKQRERWTHDIGNLTLTYDNGSLGNRPFPEKKGKAGQKGCYANSPLFIERQLAKNKDWTKDQILERREAIHKWAIDRWFVAAPPVSPEETLPPEFTVERITALAKINGVEDELRRILETIQLYGLYPYPKKWCMVIAPPRNRNLALGTIWPELGYLRVGVWHESWPRCLDIPKDEVAKHLGEETWQYLDASNISEFVSNLDRLLAQIEDNE